ncbi:hypothetical protein Lupro_09155 [Lutibacter profundi]|uniref:Uncharacterized protein n=2 Tax=Lutibacter profundi TaxID=1622118 RepID=A0A0X8G7E7_9FLAO|nr:hypothetical protein Lupro_09155 [Lutibacter profundi]
MLSSLFLSSCDSNEDKDIEDIVSLLIKKSIEDDMLYKNDSLMIKENLFINGKFIVAVHNEMTPILNNFGLRKHQNEFKETFQKLQSLKQSKKINFQIDNSLKDVLITDFTPELREDFSKGKIYKSYHMVNSFSRVAIVNNKALATYSISYSPLDGISYLVYLKKENGTWYIFDRQLLSIS